MRLFEGGLYLLHSSSSEIRSSAKDAQSLLLCTTQLFYSHKSYDPFHLCLLLLLLFFIPFLSLSLFLFLLFLASLSSLFWHQLAGGKLSP
ncbi:unnamed protein product [Protopolystoma xenopodis]|uniref:Uncharacterized protein n=1 Tax=Protopolystoma xenopodis TaxID=117903 RepID=A0A448WNS6_9PLAT|nr:unnamed protein product [Protopolystoma xenopodis]